MRALAGARHRHQVLGEARSRRGVTQEHELALEDLGGVGQLDLQAVGGVGDVAAVEVAAVEDVVGLGAQDGVVVGAVELDLDGGGRLLQDLDEDADHLGRAAHRVRILDLAGAERRPRARAQGGAHPARVAHRARVRLGEEQPLVEVRGLTAKQERRPGGERRVGAHEGLGARQAQRDQRGHDAGAVHDRERLLGRERDGREPDRGQGVAGRARPPAKIHLAVAGQDRGDVRHRRQVAAGADRAELGNARDDVLGEEPDQGIEGLEADAAPAGRQLGQPRDHDGAAFLASEQRTDAAAVKPHQVLRQRDAELERDRVHARRAEAGVDAVERLGAAGTVVDRLAGAAHALAPWGGLAEGDGEPTARDLGDVPVGDRHFADAQEHHGRLHRSKKLNQFRGASARWRSSTAA